MKSLEIGTVVKKNKKKKKKKKKNLLNYLKKEPQLLKKKKKGGLPKKSENAQPIKASGVRKFILEKEKINSASIKDITKMTTPFDFEGKLFRWCYLITR
ncbi:MAG: hypothetical protein IPQ25_16680 [Chitinophagaceae bacterium]|nr:hypothetical protein [Chitinophagaceae bacterium]